MALWVWSGSADAGGLECHRGRQVCHGPGVCALVCLCWSCGFGAGVCCVCARAWPLIPTFFCRRDGTGSGATYSVLTLKVPFKPREDVEMINPERVKPGQSESNFGSSIYDACFVVVLFLRTCHLA